MLPKNSVSRTYLLTKAFKESKDDKRGRYSGAENYAIDEAIRAAAAAQKKQADRVEAAVRRSGARTLIEKEKVRERYLMKFERTTPMADYIKQVSEPVGNSDLGSWDIARNVAKTATSESARLNQEIAGACSKNKLFGKMKSIAQSKRWSNTYFEDSD